MKTRRKTEPTRVQPSFGSAAAGLTQAGGYSDAVRVYGGGIGNGINGGDRQDGPQNPEKIWLGFHARYRYP